jgi:mitochondrial translocator assembly and maintenance protein 41
MLDFLFAVSHPAHWHSINMHQNPTHYAPLPRLFGSSAVHMLQDWGGQVWYNVDCTVTGLVNTALPRCAR